MWRLIFVASLALFFDCGVSSVIADDQELARPIYKKGSDSAYPDFETHGYKAPTARYTRLAATSNLLESQDAIIKPAASNIRNPANIDEIMKQMETFLQKLPADWLKDKSLRPMTTKFKKSYDELLKQTKPILNTARNYKKVGRGKNGKQMQLKLATLTKHIETFAKSVNDESNKQRNRNLIILRNNRNDGTMVENAKRFINVADTFSACVQWIQSIPSTINCFIFGNCPANNGSNNEGTNENEGGGAGDNGVDNDGDDDDVEDDNAGGDAGGDDVDDDEDATIDDPPGTAA